MRTRFLIFFLLIFSFPCLSQSDSIKNNQAPGKWISGSIHAAAYGGSLIILNEAWYKDFQKRSIHTFNDSREWLQIDKLGHAWGGYHVSRGSAALWKWSGYSENKSVWLGGLSSLGYLTIIEFLDAHTVKWGWSWSDMGANVFGSGLFISQELGWKEQKVQFKFSFHHEKYEEQMLKSRVDELYGKSWYERMLKDYNGQTYWLSFNLKSFMPASSLPPWLNISIGYGADGMYGGFENKWTDGTGNEVERKDIPRKRQFYIAPDLDLSKIKTNSKFVRTVFSALNGFKFPAPAIMLDSKGNFKAHALYF